MFTAAQILNASATPAPPVSSRWEQRVAWAARELGFDAPPGATELRARFVERLSDEQFMPPASASEAFCTLLADAEGIVEVDDPPPFAHAQHFSLLAKLDALQGELLSLPVGVRRERLERLKAECAHDPWPSARVALLERSLNVNVETTSQTDEPLRELIAGIIELTTLRPLPRAVRRRELVRSLQRHGSAAGLAQRVSKLRPDVAQLDPWLLVLLEKLPAEVSAELATKSSVMTGSYAGAQGVNGNKRYALRADFSWRRVAKVVTAIMIVPVCVILITIVLAFYFGSVVDSQPRYAKQRSVTGAQDAATSAPTQIATDTRAEHTAEERREQEERLEQLKEQAATRMKNLVQSAQERLEQERQQEAERQRQSQRDIFDMRPRGVDINPLDNGTQRILEESRRLTKESRQRSDKLMRDFEQRRKERETKYELERKQREEEFRKQQEETYKRLGIPPPPAFPR